MLTAISYEGSSKYKCLCDCGNEKIARKDRLLNGETSHCGCNKKKPKGGSKAKDLTGQKFNRLTVIKRVENKGDRVQWLCKCDCGNEKKVITSGLKNGTVQSCGCLHKEVMRNKLKKYNLYDLTGNYGIGYTFKGEKFYFDLEDYDKVKNYCWYINPLGYVSASSGEGYPILLHRLIMNFPEDLDIDHIHHKKIDNRKKELRICTHNQNMFNMERKNSDIKTGVYYDESLRKWRARIRSYGENIHLGVYKEYTKAVEARIRAEIKYFGEYRYEEENHEIIL